MIDLILINNKDYYYQIKKLKNNFNNHKILIIDMIQLKLK